MDTAAAHFITAVSLACATGGKEESTRSSQQQQQQQQLPAAQPQRITVMNAAGVAYTLAPSAVVSQGVGDDNDGTCVGQQWGLLPGLDATALLWALLSGGQACNSPC